MVLHNGPFCPWEMETSGDGQLMGLSFKRGRVKSPRFKTCHMGTIYGWIFRVTHTARREWLHLGCYEPGARLRSVGLYVRRRRVTDRYPKCRRPAIVGVLHLPKLPVRYPACSAHGCVDTSLARSAPVVVHSTIRYPFDPMLVRASFQLILKDGSSWAQLHGKVHP